MRRRLVEEVITDAVRERISSADQIRYVLQRVEEEVRSLCSHVPETLRLKETELDAKERRLANIVDFIGDGRGSQALAKALAETERRVEFFALVEPMGSTTPKGAAIGPGQGSRRGRVVGVGPPAHLGGAPRPQAASNRR